jgi:TM2 domain-containing membrane protein YozV
MAAQGSGGNVIAAICNLFFPGLGQLVQGRVFAAIVFFLFYMTAWAMTWILIGWVILPVVYIWAIIDAAKYKRYSGY